MSSSRKKHKEPKASKKHRHEEKADWPLPHSDGGKVRLTELFGHIEKEFDNLRSENAALAEKVESLTDKLNTLLAGRALERIPDVTSTDLTHSPASHPVADPIPPPLIQSSLQPKMFKSSTQPFTIKLKPTKKARPTLTVEWAQVRVFQGHRDGVMQVAHSKHGTPVIGSTSVDGTALIWDPDTGTPFLKYTGHSGAVNCISFHQKEVLACTVSGDCFGHVWRYLPPVSGLPRQPSLAEKLKHDSSGEERCLSDDYEDTTVDEGVHPSVTLVKTPIIILKGHKAPVMSCDWLPNAQQLVTASWDRTARLWDSEKGLTIHSLEGHDQELTHVCAHPSQQLLVTSSQDTTFRLWDFRTPPIHSVNVFQGHSKAVNAAVFSQRDNVISGSDDHTVKIWDLRKMRSPTDSIRLDIGVNRIALSQYENGVLALPLDNGHIRLYDLAGNRLAQIPRRDRQGHRRLVFSAAWSLDSHQKCNLYTSAFDNKVIGWKITFDAATKLS